MIDKDIQEKLRQKFNPDGSDLRTLQLRVLKMLEYFDTFCKKNDIKYWLASGTCLGAIRHGGFIPWDDDLDIEMFPEDYKKFLSLRDEYENEDYILQDYISDNEYITPFGKLRDKKSEVKEVHNRDNYFKYKGVFIDIFLREKGCYMSSRIAHIVQYISYTITNIKNPRIRRPVKSFCYRFMHGLLFPILRKTNKYFGEQDRYRNVLGVGFYGCIPKDGLFPLKKAVFEGKEFPIPGNADEYLKMLYGDYEKIPDTKDFRIHFKSLNLNKS